VAGGLEPSDKALADYWINVWMAKAKYGQLPVTGPMFGPGPLIQPGTFPLTARATRGTLLSSTPNFYGFSGQAGGVTPGPTPTGTVAASSAATLAASWARQFSPRLPAGATSARASAACSEGNSSAASARKWASGRAR